MKTSNKTNLIALAAVLLAFGLQPLAFGQGTAFTYQGQLNANGAPANGSYDLTFALFNSASGPTQQGSTITSTATAVSNGLFTVTLDFGNQFPGANRWLEISARTNGGGAFATLSPRQQLTSTPYSIQSANAAVASSVAAGNITGTLGTAQIPNLDASKITTGTLSDARLSTNVALRSGGNIFSGSNFFTAGSLSFANAEPIWVKSTNGTSEIFLWPRYLDDATYLDFGTGGLYVRDHTGNNTLLSMQANGTLSLSQALGDRLTLYPSIANTSYGFGISNYTLQIHTDTSLASIVFGYGSSTNLTETMIIEGNGTVTATAFVGDGSGLTSLNASQLRSIPNNTNGAYDNFFVGPSGNATTIGQENTANGFFALSNNTSGSYNTADGFFALESNTSGSYNTAIGFAALSYSTSDANTAIGFGALYLNTSGSQNTATGVDALNYNTSGYENTADGVAALYNNTSGSDNIALGYHAGYLITTGSGNIDIGNQGASSDTNIIRIGSGQTQTYIAGSLEIDAANGSHPAYAQEGYLSSSGAGTGALGAGGGVSIWAAGTVFASGYIAFSDARIKNVEAQSDSVADLKTLLGIKITDFTYKDTIAKGNAPQKKVIAQQVEQVYPQAVSKSTDVVPDIYRRATVTDGWVQLATDLKVGDRVKLIGEKEKGVYPVLEVRNGAFRTDFKPSTEQVFVYGREVKDFRNVDYEAIAMLNVSATQELARKVTKLESTLDQALTEKEALLKRLSVLEVRDQAREDRLARMESALEKGSTTVSYVSLEHR